MKKLVFLITIVLFSCKSSNFQRENASKFDNPIVQIDTLFIDSISIRAILVDKNKVWFAANKNRFGYYDLNKKSKVQNSIFNDSLTLEFRSIAQTTQNIFILSVGNPALLYKISKKNQNPVLVYQEKGEKVFYDSMQFWNETDGIAIGDPTDNCFSVLITHDGGNSWKKSTCSDFPKLADGEAAFAGSNTNVVCRGSKIFIVSGGKKARVFVSENDGISWQVFDTPIIQGEAMTGIFSADFFNENVGFVVGGNYENQSDNGSNKAITFDGGKSWRLVSENAAFGYASCVQFLPDCNGEKLVSVGTSGVYYSKNQGENWSKISNDPDLYTLRFQNKSTFFAAGKNKLIRVQLKK